MFCINCYDHIGIHDNIRTIYIHINKRYINDDDKILEQFVKKLFTYYMIDIICNREEIRKSLHIQRYSTESSTVEIRTKGGISIYKIRIKNIKENGNIDCLCTSTQTINSMIKMIKSKGFAMTNGDLLYNNKKLDINALVKDCGFNTYSFNDISYQKNIISKSKRIIKNDSNLQCVLLQECKDNIQKTVDNDKINIIQTNVNNIEAEKNIVKKSKKKTIPKKIKMMVWEKYIGNKIGTAKCMCCKTTDILQGEFHCGHMISQANGGETSIDNLRPICAQCNLSMARQNMNEYIMQYKL